MTPIRLIFLLLLFYIICKIIKNDSRLFIINLIQNNTSLKLVDRDNYNKQKFPKGVIIINNNAMFNKIATRGETGLGESYMDGDWDTDNLEGCIEELIKNQFKLSKEMKNQSISFLLLTIKENIKQKISNNTIESSKKNISSHYDIGNDLYKKMLGKHMQYTCAYFYKPNITLDEAQYAKMELIAKKLDLKSGMKVLDIGCGFGSMAKHLATKYNVNVVGVTLSKEQKIYSDKHFYHPNVSIQLKDYRHVKGKFDRVYSIGMFEHVGKKNYHEYYDKCYELLKDDGIMLLHTICNHNRKWDHNSFLNLYIFPGGEVPHIENLTGEFIDKWHLEDLQNFGMSYNKTLRCWRKNIGNWSNLEKYDIRFRRMWEYYLLSCAANFKQRGLSLWQIVYTKHNSQRLDDCHYIRN